MMNHQRLAQLLEKRVQALQMEFLYVSENLTALPTEEFGCRASGELSQPVLCLVERRRMQMGCRQGVEDGMSKGHRALLPLVRFLWTHRHSPPSPYLPPLCSQSSISACISPTFSPSTLMPLCFPSMNHPIACPRFRMFPNLVPCCFCLRVVLEGLSQATSSMPSAIAGDDLSVFPSSAKFCCRCTCISPLWCSLTSPAFEQVVIHLREWRVLSRR